MVILPQLTAGLTLGMRMLSSSDHITPVTGLTPVVTLSKNNGAFGATTGAVAEISDGWYRYTSTSTDVDTAGQCRFKMSGTGADLAFEDALVTFFNPYNNKTLGIGALPLVSPGLAGGLILRGTAAGQLEPVLGNVNLTPAQVTAILNGSPISETYPADGASGNLMQLLYLILACVSQFDVVGTSLVARKLNGTTAAASFLLDDADAPTSRTRIS